MNRVKGPLFEHWKRAFSFALYKQTVECIHHGVTNANTRQQQGNGPDGHGCDLHHEDLEQEVRRDGAATTTTRDREQLSTAQEGSAQAWWRQLDCEPNGLVAEIGLLRRSTLANK